MTPIKFTVLRNKNSESFYNFMRIAYSLLIQKMLRLIRVILHII
jgi:hypothetical protein